MTNDQLLALTTVLQPCQPSGPVFNSTLNEQAYRQLIWLYPSGVTITGIGQQFLPPMENAGVATAVDPITGIGQQFLPPMENAGTDQVDQPWKEPGCRAQSVRQRQATFVPARCDT